MKIADKPRVVAIGASAGGLDAFRKLLRNLPVDTDMAFVLLSHLLRGTKSLLPEILARSTTMPVTQVTQTTRVLANHIYVIPPDKLMEIHAGWLYLTPRPLTGANRAIDHFLFSLAKDHAAGSVGIVLSGEGSDGAEGIKILKEASGGVTMAQEPASATSQSMPVNAIQIDHVDHILSPEAIAHQLAAMGAGEAVRETAPFRVLWMKKPRPH